MFENFIYFEIKTKSLALELVLLSFNKIFIISILFFLTAKCNAVSCNYFQNVIKNDAIFNFIKKKDHLKFEYHNNNSFLMPFKYTILNEIKIFDINFI